MAENKPKPKKPRLISLRLTEAQYQYLEEMAKRIRKRTGLRVTRTSIVMKLMEYGLPYLQKDFPSVGDDAKKGSPLTKTAISLDLEEDEGQSAG